MRLEKLYLEIINNLCDGVYCVDTERRISFWNKAAEEITGYKAEEIMGKFCQNNLLSHIDREGRPLCLMGCPLYTTLVDGMQREGEVFLRHREGHRIPVIVNIFPIYEDEKIVGAIEIFTPSSPIIYEDNLIEKLSDLAMCDQLTGLPNRRKLESYLEYRFHELKRTKSKFCVLFLDIDNFGQFNNTYGHDVGDEILKTVSISIQRSMRKDDLFGRWGGEEFIGVINLKADQEATLVAEKIRALIKKSQLVHNGEIFSVTASLGVTLARDGDTVSSIVERADALMYQSKQKGKNCITADM